MKQLTDKQKQLLQLLSEDQSRKQIASEMGISPRTVESYISKLRHQFGCGSNEKLIKLCTQAGQIS